MRSLIKITLALIFIFSITSCQKIDKKSTDFTNENGFTPGIEGPAVNPEGDLFAVNFEKQGTIGRVDAEGVGEVYLTLPEGSIGNGIRFDINGNMFVADYVGHTVYRFAKNSKKAEIWERDTTMNQPNDLAIGPDGTIYLSDPNWAESTGQIWKVTQERTLELLESEMGTTNGIEVSPDGKKLYVNESVQRRIWQYDLLDNGELANKRDFLTFEDFGLDGMRCDTEGNLYITRYDKGPVLIVNPEGETIHEVELTGKKPSNIAFGGPDGKTCFVTMADRGCFEKFRAPFAGNYFSSVHH